MCLHTYIGDYVRQGNLPQRFIVAFTLIPLGAVMIRIPDLMSMFSGQRLEKQLNLPLEFTKSLHSDH